MVSPVLIFLSMIYTFITHSIYSYSQKCVECQRLNAMFEGVGANLKLRMNTARVNIENGGVKTGKRFAVENTPEFILLVKPIKK